MSNDQNKRVDNLSKAVEDHCIDLDPETASDIDPSMFVDEKYDGELEKLDECPRFLTITVRASDGVTATYGALNDDFDAARKRAIEFIGDIAQEYPVVIIDLEQGLTMRPSWGTLSYTIDK